MNEMVVKTAHDPLVRAIEAASNKDTKARLKVYKRWLDATDLEWFEVNLAAWRDDLLEEGKSPVTVSSYLSSVRGVYKRLETNNELRQSIYESLPADTSAADQKAFVDEFFMRMRNQLDPEYAKVRITKELDIPDSKHLRLELSQANVLIAKPGFDSVISFRDSAIIALFLCTGIRQKELVDLDVRDLRQSLNAKLALHVRNGKGNKSRLVPYGGLDWCLTFVDAWLRVAGILEGPVFRSVRKNGIVEDERLSTVGVEMVMRKYPIVVDGELVHVRPHDLRRSYAYLLYKKLKMRLLPIARNLGHNSIKTTMQYVGNLENGRSPESLYRVNLTKLEKAIERYAV